MRMTVAVVAAMLGGCTPAVMAGLTPIAATTDSVELRGVGPFPRGDFRLSDGATGRFSRSLDTAAEDQVDDTAVGVTRRYGGVRFTLSGGGVAGTLAGDCRFGEVEYRDLFGGSRLSLETRETLAPFRLGCRFTRDRVPVGAMGLGELPPRGAIGALPARGIVNRRAGEVEVDGRRLEIVSEHRWEGGPRWEGADALGYRFEVGGQAVGAVSTNGRGRLLLPRDPGERQAALAAGVAMALLWDPGDG